MPVLSEFAQKKKIAFFLEAIPKSAQILEVGSGSGWVGRFLQENGWSNYTGIDLAPPADIVGDINCWQELAIEPDSFDVIVAFEVVEHVNIYPACEALLKPGGRLMVTTPVPHFDCMMKCLETAGLNQKRTSPHSNLHTLTTTDRLELISCRRIAGLSQWGIFEKSILKET